MGLNIKNTEVERLAGEVAAMAGETKTQAIRLALEERKARLLGERDAHGAHEDILAFLRREIWPHIPAGQHGRRLTQDEEDEILGFGPGGV